MYPRYTYREELVILPGGPPDDNSATWSYNQLLLVLVKTTFLGLEQLRLLPHHLSSNLK